MLRLSWTWGMHREVLYLAISLLAHFESSLGILVNRTVDDELGDSVTGVLPTYQGSWNYGATCQNCLVHLDSSFVFQGTWHDATWHSGDPGARMVNVSFTGSAVFVFIVLANIVSRDTHTITNLSFVLDGETMGYFFHSPTLSTDYEYNVTAYANENLTNSLHNLTMQTTGDSASLFLFDYLVYSTDDEVTSGVPTSQTGSPILPQSTGTVPVSLPSTKPSLPMSADSNPASVPSQGSTSYGSRKASRKASVSAGGLAGGLLAAAFVIGLILYGYRRRIRSVLMDQNFNRAEGSVRPSTGLPTSSDCGETTTRVWSSSSIPERTYTGDPTYDGSSSFSQTVTSPTERLDGNMATYAQTTTEAELWVSGAPTHKPGSQAPSKSAEWQLQLLRQIEQTRPRPNLGPTRAASDLGLGQTRRGLDSGPYGDADGAEVLRKQVVLHLDGIERLNAQRASVRANDIDDEPPPDYTSEGRRSLVP